MKNGWPIKVLGEVCANLDSKRVPITKSKRTAGKYPYYGASCVVDYVADYLFDEKLLLVSEDGANLLARTYPIAFSVSGRIWVNNHAHVLKFADTASQRFIEFYLNSIPLEPFVSGMAQPKLNQKSLNSIPVPAPPLPEQRRIVGILDEAFAGIATAQAHAEKNLQNARALFESHLNAVFTQRGDGWTDSKLGDVCDFQNGYAFKSKWYTENGRGVRLLRNANVSHGFIDWSDDVVHLPNEKVAEFERFQLNKDDVILSLDRPIISTGLKAAILRDHDTPSLLLQRVLRITSEVIKHEYVFHWLFSNHFRDEIDPGRSLGVPHISAREVGNVPIIFPNTGEQKRIIKSVRKLAKSSSHLESIYQRKLAALDELKKSLLHQAFCGEL